MVKDPDAVVGEARGIFLNDARQELHTGRRHTGDGDVAAPRLAGLANLGERGRQVGQEASRLGQEGLAGIGQRD